MATNQVRYWFLLVRPIMKRICSLCRAEKPDHSVKRYPHGLCLCVKCQDVVLDLEEEAITLQRYRC